jgi:coenzyme F420-0:L-glutamate ligase/coenzyme F420-1:gamma-L-glutamate ligase
MIARAGAVRPITITPVTAIGEVPPGAPLATLIVAGLSEAGLSVQPCDIIVVTSKIVSKAENRFARLVDVVVTPHAVEIAAITRKDPRLVELVLAQSIDVVRAAPHVLITRHRLGLVMANAGIDQSNLGPGEPDRVLLLPEAPDASASALRDEFQALVGTAPAVVIIDSFGRPWRHGVVAVAIGASGWPALLDRRGELDRDGRLLEVTQVALADMVANAAGLVMGEGAEGVPVALVRGFGAVGEDCPAASLVRPIEQDLFR